MGRLAAQQVAYRLGVTVVVENRSGASGTVGAEIVRQAAPDGQTFLCAPSVHVMARHVLPAVPYDPVTDFVPVARFGQGPLLLVANAARVPGETLREALPALRSRPRDFAFGVSALGAANHLAVLEFNRLTGLDLLLVTYRGSAPALADLMAGQVSLMIDPIIGMLPHVREGRLRALAVTAPRRSAVTPNIPTAAEAGLPGLEFFSWYGVWGPAGLPAPMIERVNAALVAAAQDPGLVARLAGLGFEAVGESATEFAAYIGRDVARNVALLRAANFRPE